MFIDRMVWNRRDIKNHLVPEGTPSSRPARAGPSTASLGSLFPITLTVKDFFFFNVYSSALKLFCCSQPACFYGILKMKFFIIVLLMQLEEGCGKRPCCIWWVHLFFSGSNLFYTNAWLFSKDTLKMKQTKALKALCGLHDSPELFAEVCCCTDTEVWHLSWADGAFNYPILLGVSSRNNHDRWHCFKAWIRCAKHWKALNLRKNSL